MANALLPAQDSNPDHTGIKRIDRATVAELREIPVAYDEIQIQLDNAGGGHNRNAHLIRAAFTIALGVAFAVVEADADDRLFVVLCFLV